MSTGGRLILWVALGSAIGGVLRQLTSDLFHLVGWLDGPWDTLTVNGLGSLVIGWFIAISAATGRWPPGAGTREFVTTGLLGGYTTFSLFSLDTIGLLEAGEWDAAFGNVLATLLLCLTAVWCGQCIGRRLANR